MKAVTEALNGWGIYDSSEVATLATVGKSFFANLGEWYDAGKSQKVCLSPPRRSLG